MPIVFDSSKKLINLEVLYIEKKKSHGHVLYHFVQDKADYDRLIKKGYKMEDEIKALKSNVPAVDIPGAPKEQLNYDPDKIIYRIVTTWKQLAWKDHNNLLSKCIRTRTTPEGKSFNEIDNMLFNELLIKACLVEWDIKNERGDIVPVSHENIDNLPPDVGNELISAFNEANQLTENDLKN